MSLVIVQSLKSCSTPCLSSTISQSLLRFMSIELVMLSNILSSATLFCFYLQPFPASGSFPMSWPFASGGQSNGTSASASVLPMNNWELISLRTDWFDLLVVQGTLKSLLQHHNLKASVLRHSAFFMVQFSHLYMTTGQTIALTMRTSVSYVSAF